MYCDTYGMYSNWAGLQAQATRLLIQNKGVESVANTLRVVLAGGDYGPSPWSELTETYAVFDTLERLCNNAPIDSAALRFCCNWLKTMLEASEFTVATRTLLIQLEICATKSYSKCVSNELKEFLGKNWIRLSRGVAAICQGTKRWSLRGSGGYDRTRH